MPDVKSNKSSELAQRYAGALFELASEGNHLDAVANDLRFLKGLLQDSAEFRHLVVYPRFPRAALITTVQEMATQAKLHKLTSNFLALLAQGRRLSALEAMADAYLDELAARRGEVTAQVRTAQPLTDGQKERLTAQLRELSGGTKIHLLVHEDRSLLGGITVRMGPHLIDASVKTKLARLERQLKIQEEAA